MTLSTPRGPRSGLTLTEVLIGIMIMGIGMVSLATLFPLGLVRVRDATRNTRSTLLAENAMAEIEGRDLLGRLSFIFTWYPNADPWVQDTPFVLGNDPTTQGVYRGRGSYPAPYTFPVPFVPGPGLPVMYDPLFWAVNHQTTASSGTPITPYTVSLQPLNAQARFGSGLGFVRDDPDGQGSSSAHGLQRITNFAPLGLPVPGPLGVANVGWPFLYTVPPGLPADLVGTVFASPDDIVFQTEGLKSAAPAPGVGSPLVPDMTLGSVQTDWAFSWAFTGQRTNVSDYTIYDGAIVIFHNRAFAIDLVPAAFGGGSAQVASGERVVEAAWGWSPTVDAFGYGNGDDRTVLVRWPATQPDPTIAIGSWLADVTYERSYALDLLRYRTPNFSGDRLYTGQRCYWYQVSRRTAPEIDPGFAGDPGPYRRMILTLNSPVRAKTRLNPGGSPVHVNVALIAPNVVNVFTKVFYSR